MNTKNPLTTKAGQNNADETGGTSGGDTNRLAAKVQAGANKGLTVAPDVTDDGNMEKK